MTVNAVTDGKMLSKLYHLTDSQLIAKHLKATVQVQEVLRNNGEEKTKEVLHFVKASMQT